MSMVRDIKIFFIYIILYNILFYECSAVIYQLNDTEYERMPALSSLDDYDSCLNENDGVYCVLKVDLIAEPDNELMNLINEYSESSLTHFNHSYIERGICVKKSCHEFIKDSRLNDTADLMYILGECLNSTIFRDYGLQTKVSKLYNCDRKNDKIDITVLDWCVACVFCAIVVINVVGSLYDYILNNDQDEKTKGNKYLLSFSIIRNWEWLIESEFKEPRLRRLKIFYGARTITNLIMIFGHTIFLIGSRFIDKPHEFEKSYDSSVNLIMYNAMLIVQIFFFMSSFLLTYHYLVRAEISPTSMSWAAVPVTMFLRWWRLTPALAVALAFSVTWLRHISSGPLWYVNITGSVVSDCRKYWWYHLLYLNNYTSDDKYCAIQTWHISADTQLFFVGLIVLTATISRGRNVALAVLVVLSLILPALHVWLYDLDSTAFLNPEFLRSLNSDTFYYLHIYGHNNLASYAVGMITAILLFNWQKKGVDISENKIYAALLWLVIPGIIAVIYSNNIFYSDQGRTSLVVRMLYSGTQRLVLSLIVAFGIVVVIMKCRSILRHAIEWRGWVVTGRLTYSAYLLHFNFIYIILGVSPTLFPMSFCYLLFYYLGVVMLTYLLSVPLFLMVEAPVNRLMKNITTNVVEALKKKKKPEKI